MATVVTNTGKGLITGRIRGTGNEFSYIGWGTGAGTAAATDTTLFTESADESRTNGTSTQQTTTTTNDTWQLVGTMTCAVGSKTITNVGLFDASSGGNMAFKADFTGVALSVADAITFTLKIVLS